MFALETYTTAHTANIKLVGVVSELFDSFRDEATEVSYTKARLVFKDALSRQVVLLLDSLTSLTVVSIISK